MLNRFVYVADDERMKKESGLSQSEDGGGREGAGRSGAGEGNGSESKNENKNKNRHACSRKKREKARSVPKTGGRSEDANVTYVDRDSVSVYDLVTMTYEEHSGGRTVRKSTAGLIPAPRPRLAAATRTPMPTPAPAPIRTPTRNGSHIRLPIASARDPQDRTPPQTQTDRFSWRPAPPTQRLVVLTDDMFPPLS
jgi:hypothetical protein